MSASLSILLVDDEPNVCRLYSLILRNQGHQVATAEDGEDALEWLRLRPHDFDLMITNHQMPNVNGIALVRELRSTLHVGALIACSETLSEEIVQLYQKLGVTDTVAKPVCLSDLFSALGQIQSSRDDSDQRQAA